LEVTLRNVNIVEEKEIKGSNDKMAGPLGWFIIKWLKEANSRMGVHLLKFIRKVAEGGKFSNDRTIYNKAKDQINHIKA
jgi:hypothetical protein